MYDWWQNLLDHLIAIPISVIYWWQGLRKECPESPDGRHGLIVVKTNKAGCQYCGKPPKRVAPDAEGRDK